MFLGLQNKSWEFFFAKKTELQGDPETFTLGSIKPFDLKQPGGPVGSSKSQKLGEFSGLLNKSWENGDLVSNWTCRLPKSLTFGFM